MCVQSPSCPLCATPWTAARQAPLSMGLSRQEHCSGLPFLLQGIFLTQGLKPSLISPVLADMFFPTSATPAGDLLYKDAPFLMEALHRLPGHNPFLLMVQKFTEVVDFERPH